jgi:catechol 2,3-dioxygenase-like lactoylglutathione lyase family enzyme
VKQRLTVLTLGVSDLTRSRRFYEALGWRSDSPPEIDVAFFQSGGMVVALWDRANVAADTGLELGSGFGGVSLAHNVASDAEVDVVLAEAAAAGARITKQPAPTFWGGYSGVFLDPDGHPWEVAHNPQWILTDDGDVILPD